MSAPAQPNPSPAADWLVTKQLGRYAMRLRSIGNRASAFYELELTTDCECGASTRPVRLTSCSLEPSLQFAANVAAKLETNALNSGHATGCAAHVAAKRGIA